MKDLEVPKKGVRAKASISPKVKTARSRKTSLSVTSLPDLNVGTPVIFGKKTQKTKPARQVSAATSQSIKENKIKSPFQNKFFMKEELIVIPQNMSIRAREKALALLDYFRDDFENTAKKISTVSGFAFILFGSYLALSFSGTIKTPTQFAQLVTSVTSTSSTAFNSPTANTIAQPLFLVVDTLPSELLNNKQLTFSLTNSKNVQVKAVSLADGTILSINSRALTSELYQYDLEYKSFKPGYYSIKVFAESSATQTRYTYTIGDTKIPLLTNTPPPTTVVSTSTQQTTTYTAPASGSSLPSSPPALVSSPPVATAPTTTPDAKALSEVIPVDAKKLVLSGGANATGQSVFRIEAPPETTFLEVYARPVSSINTRFLGLAEKRIDAWYYFFNSVNVPNGDYEIHTRSRISNVFIDSNSIKVHVANFSSAAPPADQVKQAPQTVAVEPVNEAQQTRDFSKDSFEKGAASSSPAYSSVNDIFKTYRGQLDDLLKRYAVAHQTGNMMLLKTVEREIKRLKEEILTSVLDDPSKNALAHGIEEEFDLRIESLKSRIGTFEDLRRTSERDDIKKDTDGDGISDFDESSLYHTDPHLPDTDNDGFTDGIEIMRGFNPLSAVGEATVTYELPQDTVGLEQSEALKIDTVLPSIKQLNGTASIVQSEIHGKALPNSYVTLYIFSTPTIVTVRTDTDGSFVYTFEKELDDGEHQVYAAVTDNTGTIVAHSSPFTFIKQAQAYTPTNETGALGANSQTLNDYKKFNLYNTVIGVGILGLGIILLMLGFGLGKKKDEDILIVTENDLKTS